LQRIWLIRSKTDSHCGKQPSDATQEATMITLGSGNSPTLQNQVPQHHHRHQRGAPHSGSWWSKASQSDEAATAAATPSSDDEPLGGPVAAGPAPSTGGINILA
jgi:hypothetical protein